MNSVFNQTVALLSKGNVSDVVYVNNCFDEVIKHLSVNRQQVDLLFSIYVKFLDRLFGEDVAKSADISMSTTWVKGVQGGWLRALMTGVARPTSYDSSTSTRGTTNFPSTRGVNASFIESIAPPVSSLLLKLAPLSAMFDILAKIQGGYEFKINLLPTKLQMYIAEHPVYPVIQAQQQQHTLHALLKYPLHSANQVGMFLSFFSSLSCVVNKTHFFVIYQRNHISNKAALLLDAMEYFLVCLLRYPTISHNMLAPADSSASTSSSSPSRSSPLDVLQNRGVSSWIRGMPYLALLQEYLMEYIPIAQANQQGNGEAGASTVGGTDSSGNDNGLELDAQRLRYRELFVQLAVAYWIDCSVILKSDHHKIGVLRKAMAGGPATAPHHSTGR